MKKNLITLLFAVTLFGCNESTKRHQYTPAEMKARVDSLKTELLQTDIAFSQLSQEKGRNAAFAEYADSAATMLQPFNSPLTGKQNILGHLTQHPDTNYVLSWLPIAADVARSGDIGYTYGTYILELKGKSAEEGTYCTIWKRENRKQAWKFVLGTGNEGLKPEDRE